jgi:hypothetical protein
VNTISGNGVFAQPCSTYGEPISQPTINEVVELNTRLYWAAFDVGPLARRVLTVAETKKRVEVDIPAIGGYLDEYWEVDMGDEILIVRRPKDPVADLVAIGESLTEASLDDLLTGMDEEAEQGVLADFGHE